MKQNANLADGLSKLLAIAIMAQKQDKEKTVSVTIRVPLSMNESLGIAENATGSNKTDLVIECVKCSLRHVVDELVRTRAEATKEWLARASQPESIVKRSGLPEVDLNSAKASEEKNPSRLKRSRKDT